MINYIITRQGDKEMYDFSTWTSFPSSLKLVGVDRQVGVRAFTNVSVTPGSKLRITLNAKQKDVVSEYRSNLAVYAVLPNGELRWLHWIPLPRGTFDWKPFSFKEPEEKTIPPDAEVILGTLWTGYGTPEAPGITWFDDLRVYQDDVLIYDNYFSAIRPGKIVPVKQQLPEVIIGAWQRRKQKRLGTQLAPQPIAVVA